jgi:hypothetical protein
MATRGGIRALNVYFFQHTALLDSHVMIVLRGWAVVFQ